jgi:hypothetical protein
MAKGINDEPKIEVPAEIRELVAKTIDQTEKAFSFFVDVANSSMVSQPAKTTLLLVQQNIKAAFDHARKLANAKTFKKRWPCKRSSCELKSRMPVSFCEECPASEIERVC